MALLRATRPLGRGKSEDSHKMKLTKDLDDLKLPNFAELDCFRCPEKRTRVTKLVSTQQAYLDKEPIIFNLLPARRNLLAYLYFLNNETAKAADLVRQVLADGYTSLVAQDLSVRIKLNQKEYEGAKNIIDDLKAIDQDQNSDLLILLAKAEQALCLASFGPVYYHRATRLYENVLGLSSPFNSASSQSGNETTTRLRMEYPKMHLLYGYELAINYGRLMNHDNHMTFQDDQDAGPFNPDECFKVTKKLLIEVICSYEKSSNTTNNTKQVMDTLGPMGCFGIVFGPQDGLRWLRIVAARSWMDLGAIYKRYQMMGKNSDRCCKLPWSMTAEDCFHKGFTLEPQDSVVLTQMGRFHETRKASDFKYVIELLEKCVELVPGRHVAYHHLGLAYRKAWIHSCKYEEVRLFIQHNRPSSNDTRRNTPTKEEDDLTSGFDHLSLRSGRRGRRPEYSPASRAQRGNRGNQKTRHTSRSSREYDLGEFPKPESPKPPYFLKLRTNNPKEVEGKGNVDYLNKAEENLLKANELVMYTSVTYLVDLARVYISRDCPDKAKDLFYKEENISNSTCTDKCYLYEQWGLLEESLAENQDQIAKVKTLYLEAIRFAIAACKKSLAFYKLHSIVEAQLAADRNNESLIKQQAVLYHLVQLYDKAKPILKGLHNHYPEDIEVAWYLVDLFHRTGDISSAFQYLAITHSRTKHRSELLSGFPGGWEALACEVCFDAVHCSGQHDAIKGQPTEVMQQHDAKKGQPTEVMQQHDANKGQPTEVMQQYDAIKGQPMEVMQQHNANKGQPTEVMQQHDAIKGQPMEVMHLLFDMLVPPSEETVEYHVMIVGQDSCSPLIESMVGALKEIYRLNIFLACIEGFDDIDPGSSMAKAVENMARSGTRCILFLEDDILDDENKTLKLLVEGIMLSPGISDHVIVRCVKTNRNPSKPMPLALTKVPTIELNVNEDVGTAETRQRDFGEAIIRGLLKNNE